MTCSIEGEGLLYDGEDKNWPDPQSWNDEQIFSWMVRWVLVRHIKIRYFNGKKTHKRSKRDLYHTRIYLLPRGYPHSLTPRSICATALDIYTLCFIYCFLSNHIAFSFGKRRDFCCFFCFFCFLSFFSFLFFNHFSFLFFNHTSTTKLPFGLHSALESGGNGGRGHHEAHEP